MRNIKKYPVTKKEVVKACHDASWRYAYDDNQAIGNVTAYALRLAALWIEKHGPEHFHE